MTCFSYAGLLFMVNSVGIVASFIELYFFYTGFTVVTAVLSVGSWFSVCCIMVYTG